MKLIFTHLRTLDARALVQAYRLQNGADSDVHISYENEPNQETIDAQPRGVGNPSFELPTEEQK